MTGFGVFAGREVKGINFVSKLIKKIKSKPKVEVEPEVKLQPKVEPATTTTNTDTYDNDNNNNTYHPKHRISSTKKLMDYEVFGQSNNNITLKSDPSNSIDPTSSTNSPTLPEINVGTSEPSNLDLTKSSRNIGFKFETPIETIFEPTTKEIIKHIPVIKGISDKKVKAYIDTMYDNTDNKNTIPSMMELLKLTRTTPKIRLTEADGKTIYGHLKCSGIIKANGRGRSSSVLVKKSDLKFE
jgi:hypothetical protein